MRQIIVAFERQSSCEKLQSLVESGDEFSCVLCRSGAQVRRAAQKLRPDIVVCGFKLADESGEALFYDLPPGCTVLMLSSPANLALCEAGEILKLPTPVSRPELLACLRMLERLGRGRAPRSAEPPDGDAQALVAAAKERLCGRFAMTEAQAHRFLQKKSMDAGLRLAQAAKAVLDSL